MDNDDRSKGEFVVLPRMVLLGYDLSLLQAAMDGLKESGVEMRYPTKLLSLLLEHLLRSDASLPNPVDAYSNWLCNRINGVSGEIVLSRSTDVDNIVIVALDALDGVAFRLNNAHLLYTPDGVRPLYRVHEVTETGVIRLCLNELDEEAWRRS